MEQDLLRAREAQAAALAAKDAEIAKLSLAKDAETATLRLDLEEQGRGLLASGTSGKRRRVAARRQVLCS